MEIWPAAKQGLLSLRERVRRVPQAGGRERLLYGPEMVVAVSWFSLATLLVTAFHESVEAWWVYALVNLALVTAAVLFSRYVQRCPVGLGNWIRAFGAVGFILCAYTELGYILPAIRPTDQDELLIAIDRWLFGVDPTVWLERFTHPVLTEVLQAVYATFYFLPVAFGGVLIVKGRHREFDATILTVVLSFYLSYLGYVLVPAVGPRFTLREYQSIPLEGVWSYGTVSHVLNSIEPTKKDCFPSGHTLVALAVLWCAWRYHRRSLLVFGPVALGIVFSTVYLRYHYAIDLVAAAVLLVPIAILSPRLASRYVGHAERLHDDPELAE
ncbi:MAG: phosphatase PAP2 family protein [Planctomycetes bacterium]|nr:phosphatase PAP2 family protein [Planctomycetota bacterium]